MTEAEFQKVSSRLVGNPRDRVRFHLTDGSALAGTWTDFDESTIEIDFTEGDARLVAYVPLSALAWISLELGENPV
jgi:hypothetical protein